MSVFPWCHNQLFVKTFVKLVVTTPRPSADSCHHPAHQIQIQQESRAPATCPGPQGHVSGASQAPGAE